MRLATFQGIKTAQIAGKLRFRRYDCVSASGSRRSEESRKIEREASPSETSYPLRSEHCSLL